MPETSPFVVYASVLSAQPHPIPSTQHGETLRKTKGPIWTCYILFIHRPASRHEESGALTGRLSCVPWKPARQIASSEPMPSRTHHPFLKPRPAPLRSRPYTPLPTCFVPLRPSGTCVQCVEVIAMPKMLSRVAKPTDMLPNRRSKCRENAPHYACGLESGRLTPCSIKVPMSAKKSRRRRGMSARSAALCPRTWPDRGRGLTLNCPRPGLDLAAAWPRPGRANVHAQSAPMSTPSPRQCPRPVRADVHAQSTLSPRRCRRPVREHDARNPVRLWVGGGRVNLLLAPSPFCAPN